MDLTSCTVHAQHTGRGLSWRPAWITRAHNTTNTRNRCAARVPARDAVVLRAVASWKRARWRCGENVQAVAPGVRGGGRQKRTRERERERERKTRACARPTPGRPHRVTTPQT